MPLASGSCTDLGARDSDGDRRATRSSSLTEVRREEENMLRHCTSSASVSRRHFNVPASWIILKSVLYVHGISVLSAASLIKTANSAWRPHWRTEATPTGTRSASPAVSTVAGHNSRLWTYLKYDYTQLQGNAGRLQDRHFLGA